MKVDFKNLDVSWLPECIEDNFLIQVLSKPNREDALLDLMVIEEEQFTKEVEIRDILGCSDRALIEFVILRRVGLAKTEAEWFLHS